MNLTYSKLSENFAAFEKKAIEVYKNVRKELGAELLANKFPFTVAKDAGPFKSKQHTHINYDAEFNKGKEIKHLKATGLTIHIASILRSYRDIDIPVTEELLLKTIEVLCVHQFNHINLYGKKNFKKNALYKDGKLVIGGFEDELLCFGITIRHFDKKGDNLAVALTSLLHTLFVKEYYHMEESATTRLAILKFTKEAKKHLMYA